MKPFDIIVAHDANFGISHNGAIPWQNKNDMRFFQRTTSTTTNNTKMNAIIMGRKTWDSLPTRPLKNRINIVVSNTMLANCVVHILPTFDDAHIFASYHPHVEKIFVIGGETIYRCAIESPHCRNIYATKILDTYSCDRHMSDYVAKRFKAQATIDTAPTHTTVLFSRPTENDFPEEMAYLNLCRKILDEGESRDDRTGVGTKSLFGERLVFDLSTSFPFSLRNAFSGVLLLLNCCGLCLVQRIRTF
jgi:dihydrofolate reductase